MLCGILLGDFMHNLCDGLFIGVGFLACGPTLGWSITAATVYHELAQEISDYLILTNPLQGGLKPLTALLCNFVSGLSCLLGVIIILSQETVSNRDIGLLLAYSGGVYVQIAAAECTPQIYKYAETPGQRALGLLVFCIGAVGIGVVLLDHMHCSVAAASGEEDDPHAGHNH